MKEAYVHARCHECTRVLRHQMNAKRANDGQLHQCKHASAYEGNVL